MAPDKITAKNLSYDQTLPPFLARLRGQQAATTGHGPDPLLAARRRPTRVRTASEEAEDAPLVLDADGNVVDGAGRRLGLEDEDEDEEDKAQEKPAAVTVLRDAEAEAVPKTSSEKVASIGAAPNKKRKMGRVVGGGDEDENPEDEEARRVARAVAASYAIVGGDAGGEDEKTKNKMVKKKKSPEEAALAGPKKKKAKKIKLSFGDDEDAAG